MSRKFIDETIERINRLMGRNGKAKTYLELSEDDNNESMSLVSRIEEIAEAMTKFQKKNLPDQEKELYDFVETITEAEIDLFKRYCAWFRSLSGRKGKCSCH